MRAWSRTGDGAKGNLMSYPYHIKQAQLQQQQQAAMADEAGVYLPTGSGDAQRMELLNMPGAP